MTKVSFYFFLYNFIITNSLIIFNNDMVNWVIINNKTVLCERFTHS